MDRKTKNFIKIMQSLNEAQQVGLLAVTEGARGIYENKKKRRINRRSFHPEPL